MFPGLSPPSLSLIYMYVHWQGSLFLHFLAFPCFSTANQFPLQLDAFDYQSAPEMGRSAREGRLQSFTFLPMCSKTSRSATNPPTHIDSNAIWAIELFSPPRNCVPWNKSKRTLSKYAWSVEQCHTMTTWYLQRWLLKRGYFFYIWHCQI